MKGVMLVFRWRFFTVFLLLFFSICIIFADEGEKKCGSQEIEHKQYLEKEQGFKKQDKGFMLKDELFEKLDLSEEQKKGLDELFKTHRESIRSITKELKEKNAPKEEFQIALKKAKEEFDASLGKILTAEQSQKLDRLKSEYSQKIKEKRQLKENRMPFKEKLNLTEEQEKQFDEIKEKYESLHKELNEKMKEELKGILTEEQLDKLEGLKKGPEPGEK